LRPPRALGGEGANKDGGKKKNVSASGKEGKEKDKFKSSGTLIIVQPQTDKEARSNPSSEKGPPGLRSQRRRLLSRKGQKGCGKWEPLLSKLEGICTYRMQGKKEWLRKNCYGDKHKGAITKGDCVARWTGLDVAE